MAKRFRVAGNKAAIWTGEGDTAPFDNPLGNLGRVKFHSDLNYIQVIDEKTFNVALPTRSNFKDANQIYPLYQHGRGGVPFVMGKVIVDGNNVACCGSIPIQMNVAGGGGGPNFWPIGFARWISIGADNVWVYLYEYVVNFWQSGSSYNEYPAITVPVTVWMTNELI